MSVERILVGFRALVVVGLLMGSRALSAQAPRPPPAAAIDVQERLGARVPLGAAFVDTNGRSVTLRDYFDGVRPVLLTLAYSRCPMLCDLVLRGALEAMPQLEMTLGREFRALTVLIDPSESSETASQKQATLLSRLGRTSAAADDWPFLFGSAVEIRRVADAVGFGYVKDERSGQFAHPAVVILLTPDGRVSSYLHGVRFPPETVRRGLRQAASGKTERSATLGEAIMRCFRFDPALRRYGPSITAMFRWGGLFLLLSVVLVLVWLFRWERRRS